MSAWGGPKRRIYGVLGFELFSGLCFLLIGLRPVFWITALGAFGAHLTIAVVFGSNRAIWQSKTPPDLQGRVFGLQEALAGAARPLAYLLAGPLAERVFDPLFVEGGALAVQLGPVWGVGPGRGIGFLFGLMGLAKIAITVVALSSPRVRRVETELPDAI
jgi:hypothetical protein